MGVALHLRMLPYELAICTLEPSAPIPTWVVDAPFFALTRTVQELSIVCPATYVPSGITVEMPWFAFEVAGPLDFSLPGILVAVANPLAAAGIPIFAISSYLTDYLLVHAANRDASVAVLRRAGHTLQLSSTAE